MFWNYLQHGSWRIVWVNGTPADLLTRLSGSAYWRPVFSVYA